MTNQPFPNIQTPITTKTGVMNPVWRNFFVALWARTGGSIATPFATLNGSATEAFNAANAATATEVVPLGQADARYAAFNGSSSETFSVADAVASTDAVALGQAQTNFAAIGGSAGQTFEVATATTGTEATPKDQVSALITAAIGAAGAAIASITVGASPYAYTATARGSVNVNGGTVSGITLTRGATTINLSTSGLFQVATGDVLTVTYTGAPTMNFVPF